MKPNITKDTQYLSEKELIERWRGRVTRESLNNMRYLRRSPSWTKVANTVLFVLDSVVEYEKMNLRE